MPIFMDLTCLRRFFNQYWIFSICLLFQQGLAYANGCIEDSGAQEIRSHWEFRVTLSNGTNRVICAERLIEKPDGSILLQDQSGTFQFFTKDQIGHKSIVDHSKVTSQQLRAKNPGQNEEFYKFNGKEVVIKSLTQPKSIAVFNFTKEKLDQAKEKYGKDAFTTDTKIEGPYLGSYTDAEGNLINVIEGANEKLIEIPSDMTLGLFGGRSTRLLNEAQEGGNSRAEELRRPKPVIREATPTVTVQTPQGEACVPTKGSPADPLSGFHTQISEIVSKCDLPTETDASLKAKKKKALELGMLMIRDPSQADEAKKQIDALLYPLKTTPPQGADSGQEMLRWLVGWKTDHQITQDIPEDDRQIIFRRAMAKVKEVKNHCTQMGYSWYNLFRPKLLDLGLDKKIAETYAALQRASGQDANLKKELDDLLKKQKQEDQEAIQWAATIKEDEYKGKAEGERSSAQDFPCTQYLNKVLHEELAEVFSETAPQNYPASGQAAKYPYREVASKLGELQTVTQLTSQLLPSYFVALRKYPDQAHQIKQKVLNLCEEQIKGALASMIEAAEEDPKISGFCNALIEANGKDSQNYKAFFEAAEEMNQKHALAEQLLKQLPGAEVVQAHDLEEGQLQITPGTILTDKVDWASVWEQKKNDLPFKTQWTAVFGEHKVGPYHKPMHDIEYKMNLQKISQDLEAYAKEIEGYGIGNLISHHLFGTEKKMISGKHIGEALDLVREMQDGSPQMEHLQTQLTALIHSENMKTEDVLEKAKLLESEVNHNLILLPVSFLAAPAVIAKWGGTAITAIKATRFAKAATVLGRASGLTLNAEKIRKGVASGALFMGGLGAGTEGVKSAATFGVDLYYHDWDTAKANLGKRWNEQGLFNVMTSVVGAPKGGAYMLAGHLATPWFIADSISGAGASGRAAYDAYVNASDLPEDQRWKAILEHGVDAGSSGVFGWGMVKNVRHAFPKQIEVTVNRNGKTFKLEGTVDRATGIRTFETETEIHDPLLAKVNKAEQGVKEAESTLRDLNKEILEINTLRKDKKKLVEVKKNNPDILELIRNYLPQIERKKLITEETLKTKKAEYQQARLAYNESLPKINPPTRLDLTDYQKALAEAEKNLTAKESEMRKKIDEIESVRARNSKDLELNQLLSELEALKSQVDIAKGQRDLRARDIRVAAVAHESMTSPEIYARVEVEQARKKLEELSQDHDKKATEFEKLKKDRVQATKKKDQTRLDRSLEALRLKMEEVNKNYEKAELSFQEKSNTLDRLLEEKQAASDIKSDPKGAMQSLFAKAKEAVGKFFNEKEFQDLRTEIEGKEFTADPEVQAAADGVLEQVIDKNSKDANIGDKVKRLRKAREQLGAELKQKIASKKPEELNEFWKRVKKEFDEITKECRTK